MATNRLYKGFFLEQHSAVEQWVFDRRKYDPIAGDYTPLDAQEFLDAWPNLHQEVRQGVPWGMSCWCIQNGKLELLAENWDSSG